MKPDADGWLRCECCNLPFARLVGGTLIVQSYHSGKKHINAVAVVELSTEQVKKTA